MSDKFRIRGSIKCCLLSLETRKEFHVYVRKGIWFKWSNEEGIELQMKKVNFIVKNLTSDLHSGKYMGTKIYKEEMKEIPQRHMCWIAAITFYIRHMTHVE